MFENLVEFEEFKGKTPVEIEGKEGNQQVNFKFKDGSEYKMFHMQDCCEDVRLEEIIGNLDNLIDYEILSAEEVTSTEDPEGYNPEYPEWRESYTWTFYKLSTIRGDVTLRWLGESNGYYGEEVDIEKII